MNPKVTASKPKTKTGTKKEEDKKRQIALPRAITVSQLAGLLGVSPIEVIKDLMKNGVMANLNQAIDYATAASAAADFDFEVLQETKQSPVATVKEIPRPTGIAEDHDGSQKPRPPVVTIMGHVDHGKTTLLDVIRKSNVVATEAGEITQHIGAYQVEVNGQKITFLDTPGHEAFTAMRARGAQATDIAVLVVAADDGVMPQTVEAINHAKAAGVPIVVAINKIDKPNANPDKVKQQLADHDLLIEEWGGQTICIPLSAKEKEGVSELLENLLVVAEVSELKANPQGRAMGVVIEAQMDTTKGPLATVLVQQGTLKVGDHLTAGETVGKVKALFDDRGQRVKKAEPATPVKVLGLSSVPHAGDLFSVVGSEKEGRVLAQKRREESEKESMALTKAPLLDTLYDQIREGMIKELNIILKADVQGSIEPIKTSVERLSTEEVKVRVLHSGSGSVTESDVSLAIASKGIIIGFNTRPEPGAKRLADFEGVDMRFYNIIYKLVDDIEKALVGMLEPVYEEVVVGHAEVRAVFSVRKKKVAGVYVTDGKAVRNALAKVLRKGELVHSSEVSSLKHLKDDVTEISTGAEAGVGIEGYSDFEIGDIIEFYRKEQTTRK